MARPMPEVEPVTSAVFPFNMTIPNSRRRAVTEKRPYCLTFARSGGNLRRFLLQRNIKIGGLVTFSRFRSNRYNAGKGPRAHRVRQSSG
jgi:hypothetical protein